MHRSLRQLVLCVLVAYLADVVAGVEQTTDTDTLKHNDDNSAVQQTPDLTAPSELITRSVYSFGVNR